MADKNVLAFDYGASSGRAIKGIYDGNKITLKEIHRFSNDPVTINGTMYWDTLRLFHELKQGLVKAKLDGGFDSLGIDTWGVDFGLIDKCGSLVGNPVHYRDARTAGMIEKSGDFIDKNEFYDITGNQFMELNTAFQLLSLKLDRPDLLDRTETMLLTPDLLGYFLTGIKRAEYSIASTTQLMDARGHCWSDKVINALGLPKRIFPEIIPSGTKLGPILPEITKELGLDSADVIAICGHDTQDALVSVPASEKDFIFISCGTWSLFGTELDAPIINDESYKLNVTNEGGFGGKTSFLKNIIGLWLIQESRRQWIREGKEYSFGELEKMAKNEKAFRCFIDPDAPEFVPAGNIPERIREYCRRTGQSVPENEAQIVRCIDESLAFKYRDSLAEIEVCTGKDYHTIYLVGGGTQSGLLCAMTANACHKRVSAGPVEATVYGNLVLQLISSGELGSIEEARELIRKSPDIKIYEPENETAWEDAYHRYLEVTKG
ncbi:MAG: rhamnulokinase family protein [Lachnospiraceae bacterium]